MSGHIPVGQIHHLRLTVTDVQRSREFYTGLLGFEVVVESLSPGDPAEAEAFKVLFGGVVMARGNLIMGQAAGFQHRRALLRGPGRHAAGAHRPPRLELGGGTMIAARPSAMRQQPS